MATKLVVKPEVAMKMETLKSRWLPEEPTVLLSPAQIAVIVHEFFMPKTRKELWSEASFGHNHCKKVEGEKPDKCEKCFFLEHVFLS